ncbi:MAG: hypothetical protein V1702_00030 [Candidatus Woesearchaeota archaeon]
MIVGKTNIRPTTHYLIYHSDVEWDIVIATRLTPTKSHPNRRLGKDRFTHTKVFKEFIIEIHTKEDEINDIIWVINAFKMVR